MGSVERRFVDDVAGFGLVASRSFNAGDILFEEEPLVYLPDPMVGSPSSADVQCGYCYQLVSTTHLLSVSPEVVDSDSINYQKKRHVEFGSACKCVDCEVISLIPQ